MPAAPATGPVVAGAFHVHTNRSDGSGSPDDVAAAAAAAGLQFVILTDHGDGTRAPDPPQYRSGVLVIDSVELSTSGGHYIAVGMPRAPYPLRGEPRDVVEDVRRLGGFGVVAHPESPKPTLQWREWDAEVDALEWLNADAEWRDERVTALARAAIRYPFRPVETLGSILDRPETALARWDSLTQRRPVTALTGADAHAGPGWSDEDGGGFGWAWFLKIPSYETSFRTFSVRVLLDRPFSGDAGADAARLISSLRAGRVFSAIDAIASPAALEFSASAENRTVSEGALLDATGPVSFKVRTPGGGGEVVLRRDGAVVARQPTPSLEFQSQGPGTYRAEIYVSRAPGMPAVPWIVSNPIYVHPEGWGSPREPAHAPSSDGWSIQAGPWTVETDRTSTAEVTHATAPDAPVELLYALGAGPRAAQYAALVIGVGRGLEGRTQLSFRARASQPMRLSVQARRPESGERWQRSLYLDQTGRPIVLPFAEMRPVGSSTEPFDPARVDTVLFVVDTTNTQPGTKGRVVIEQLRIER
jgi:hypothetical protein